MIDEEPWVEPSPVADPDRDGVDAIVLGAGISGLAAARALARSGCRVVVLEAAARPGGALVSEARDGFLAELGPNTVQESPALLALAADAGCAEDLVPAAAAARRRFVVHHGRLVALPGGPPGLLTTPLLSWRGKARLATEPWRRRGSGPHETVAAFFRRRLGHEALPLADAMGLGVFAGDPDELAVGFAFRRAYALEREHGSLLRGMLRATPGPPRRLLACRGGFGALADRLAQGLDIRYSLAAHAVTRDPAGRFVVSAGPGASPLVLTAPRLVVALPAGVTAALLAPLAGEPGAKPERGPDTRSRAAAGSSSTDRESPAADRPGSPAGTVSPHRDDAGEPGAGGGGALAAIASIPHAPVALVVLGYRRAAVSHPLDGFGFLAPHREERQILGCLFSSTLFPDRAPADHVLLTAMVGGRRRADLVDRGDGEITDLVRQELAALLGARGEPALAIVRRWVPGIPQPDAHWPEARDAAQALEAGNPGLTVLGNWLHGVGVPDCAAAGWGLGPSHAPPPGAS